MRSARRATGGLTAANYLYNIAPKDGTVIELIDRGIPTAELAERTLGARTITFWR